MNEDVTRFSAPKTFTGVVGAGVANAAQRWVNDSRPGIELPGEERLLSDFAQELGAALTAAELFRRGDKIVATLTRDKRGLRPVDPEEFRTLTEKHVRCYRSKPPKNNEVATVAVHRTMSTDDARGVMQSPQFLDLLRTVEQVNDVPLPVLRADGAIELLAPGYDHASATLTLHAGKYEAASLNQARKEIDQLFAEFAFADARSKGVAVAAMLTLFASGLMPSASLRPAFVYIANAPGAGKTICADCAVVPVLGRSYRTPPPEREEEMQKTLLSAVIAAQPVIFFDNMRRHVSSSSLEALLTSPHFSGRVLSASQMFSGENRSTVFITGNGCTVSQDIERRALFVELFSEHARPEDRVYSQRLSEVELIGRRWRLLGALWAFVRHWDENGRPEPSKTRAGYEPWCDTIGAIVEAAGFGCPVEKAQLRDGGDTDRADFVQLVLVLHAEQEFARLDFSGVVTIAAKHGLFERGIGDGEGLDRSTKARFAKYLARHDAIVFPGTPSLRFCIEGKGHQRTYRVEVVKGRD